MNNSYLWLKTLGNGRKWALGLAYEEPLYTKKFGFYPAGNRELTILDHEVIWSNLYFWNILVVRFEEERRKRLKKRKTKVKVLRESDIIITHKCHKSIMSYGTV